MIKKPYIYVFFALGLFLLTAFIYLWPDFHLSLRESIDVNKFSSYGTLIAGVFSFLTFLMIIFAYYETKLQSIENAFFSQLDIHNKIISDLKSNDTYIEQLNMEYWELFKNNLCSEISDTELNKDCLIYANKERTNDFFEIMYRTLHVCYSYKGFTLYQFFKDRNWKIGHCLRSYTSIILYVVESSNLKVSKKFFYSNILISHSSNDELRIVFYYILSLPETPEQSLYKKIKLCQAFNQLGFYEAMDSVIKEIDRQNFMKFVERKVPITTDKALRSWQKAI